MHDPAQREKHAARRNGRIALPLAGLVFGMVALTFASVPLYRIFCQVTGYGGTTQRAETAPAADRILERTMLVRFDSNVSRDLPWRFEPVQREMRVRIGEQNLAFYRATNHSDEPVTGNATYNVTPMSSGSYFGKIACFCFTEQTLQPGESVEMPVSFYIDPAIVDDESTKDILDITLSYTFFAGAPAPDVAARRGAEQGS
jgi:cytochrome c oxidase assembly protein subunit 11